MAVSYRKLDWVTIALYLVLVLFGWMNIYSSSYQEDVGLFDLSTKYGMHMVWIITAFAIAFVIMSFISPKVYLWLSWPIYIFIAILLIAVIFLGIEVNGSKSWFAIGPIRFQPAEFSKISTSLALAYLMSKYNFSFSSKLDTIKAFATILIPIAFTLMEKETGSALVYLGFLLVFYRENMSGWVLVIGILSILLFILTLVSSPIVTIIVLSGILVAIASLYARNHILTLLIGTAITVGVSFLPKVLKIEFLASRINLSPDIFLVVVTAPLALIGLIISLLKKYPVLKNLLLGYLCGLALIFSVQFVFDKVLQEHQKARIETLLGIKEDPMGVGYNVHQSMIAIGSGKLLGKGFLNGTQTRFDFVPEQSTDFIFCTIGEEWGFLGTLFVLAVYLTIITRIMRSAEKHTNKFTRIYGYCTASCILMHVIINISMTIGLMPVIGIPLPFLSYGGSSLWTFTILLFIYLRLDLEHWNNY